MDKSNQGSLVNIEVKEGRQIIPTREQRRRIPLVELLGKALEDGKWDGNPAELTPEDRIWIDMPPLENEQV